jgi:hypothetical protein
MSSLWTPDGERPIKREVPPPPAAAAPVSHADEDFDDRDADDPSDEELRAMNQELRAMNEELVQIPASAIVANHCIGFFQLAAAHLQSEPPNLSDSQVAIDAMAHVVEGLKGRLGPDEGTLIDALAQIRLIYVQVSGAFRAR